MDCRLGDRSNGQGDRSTALACYKKAWGLYAEASPEHPPPALPAATTLSTDAMAAVLKERREQLEPLWHPEVLNESVLGAAASIVPTHPGTGAGVAVCREKGRWVRLGTAPRFTRLPVKTLTYGIGAGSRRR